MSVKLTKRTKIDNKMLEIAKRFIQEDFLILNYSQKERRTADGTCVAI